MAQILIRNLDEKTVERLKERARRRGRSVQAEAKMILTQAVGIGFEQARDLVKKWQERLANRANAGTTQLLREDRQR